MLVAPALAVLLFTYGYPVVELVQFSLHRRGRDEWVGLLNYEQLFLDSVFWTSVEHNLMLLSVIPLLVSTSIVVAAVLRDRVRGWRVYRVIIFLPQMMPVVVVGIAFGYILETHGLFNAILDVGHLDDLAQNWLGDPRFALAAVAAVIFWRQLGFGVILLLARMVQIPNDLYEAAQIDGAGWWRTLRHVTVPELRTIVAFYVGMIVIELFSWVFNYIYVLTKGGPGFSTYISEYYIYDRAFGYDQLGLASAFAVVLIAVVFVAMFGYFTWLRRVQVA